ncbi:MAG: glutamate synthase large subunit [Alicyclobacillaceae bacterium]|nr:glutamate synthase large subunit [Alicyclobacillaceae bacterium]
MKAHGFPAKQGLYDPRFEHDACGIGFVADIHGRKSNRILRLALTALANLDHRGGQGAEPSTGDGAGLLMQIPHRFLEKVCSAENITLPEAGRYGVGMLFLPQDEEARRVCETRLADVIAQEGLVLLGWRTVPTDNTSLGKAARACEPVIRQVFIGRGKGLDDADGDAFERKLYVVRRRAERAIRYAGDPRLAPFYCCSLSSRTLVYKGMLTARQLADYFLDLQDESIETALTLVHSRFSTNTFPSWERAHPYRYIIHNGEINTLRGNVNWMRAREGLFASELFGNDLEKILPVIDEDGSDTAMLDNTVEFLTLAGRSLPHTMMMLVPEPWMNHESMSDDKRAFYEYHSCLMEPWDGPAAVVFTDGRQVGAILDRNGLRPARWCVTRDGLMVLASETGVLDIPPQDIVQKDRLRPGRMLLVDLEEGRIVSDDEIKSRIAREQPYQQWLDEHLVELDDLPAPPPDAAGPAGPSGRTDFVKLQQAFGYTYEEITKTLEPMVTDATDPVSSMGIDSPLAVLSDQPHLLYNYFKQLFAQVTNPPIDAIREEIVTATATTLGSEGNLLHPRPESCRQIRIQTPILTNEELAKLVHIRRPGFWSAVLPMLFPAAEGARGLERALEEMFVEADRLVAAGVNLLVLSDRGVDEAHAPIPALLAVSGLHHHLIRRGTRAKVSLIVESGEPREVHHFALLIGYGAGAVNPYLAFDTLTDCIERGSLAGYDAKEAIKRYVKAATKGVVKVISKMGISTIQSYRGAQIFEAVGLAQPLVDRYFTWTPSRLGGVGLDVLAEETLARHRRAFPQQEGWDPTLDSGGLYEWRQNSEEHLFNPQTIHDLQQACRRNDYQLFKRYSAAVNDHSRRLKTLRGLLEFRFAPEPVPLDEVEPVESICRRFKTGAMSYGSISKEAHEALAIAMNRIGGKSNTGEGGEDPSRFERDPNGDWRRSAIKQVASGRFGVSSHYLVNADELQIKMAQGAKPGEGGQLPGRKVYPWIAEVRHSTPGVGLISPPPHHDIYSIEDLAELIHDLKNANPRARISVKLVSEVGVGTIAAGVAKGRADVVLISGYDGGTGASPRTSILHAGLPWELGLAETHQTLMLNGLRDRIVVETDGKLMTGRDVVIAALLGAEEFGFATAPLVVLGCVMMRVCHLDTCPVGVATQNPELRQRFQGDPQHVVNFMRFIAQEVREWMALLGFRTVDEMVGRTDKLEPRQAVDHWKAKGLDLSPILYQPPAGVVETERYCCRAQEHGVEASLDATRLIPTCRPALERGERVEAAFPIRNTNRVVGTLLGSEITRRYGAEGLADDTIRLHFTGSAGQSFGAFLPRGVTMVLEGDANDYVGKGLSGGRLIIHPPREARFRAEENVIIGNVALYGAIAGEAFIRGVAGERFCVRNSGAMAVVEGVGDHGCEYMTGGRVVVLGSTGRNFAAGMSGGIAYVFDEEGDFRTRCNPEMVWLEPLEDAAEVALVRSLIERHRAYTGSERAQAVLDRWPQAVGRFVRVIPKDYKRMLDAMARARRMGLSGQEAIMAAFEDNKNDLARVSGN